MTTSRTSSRPAATPCSGWRQLPREAGRAVLIGYREGLPDRLARQVGNWLRDNRR